MSNMKITGDIMKKTLFLICMMLALALTACAAKPAVPTATDFEVQPGEYRYQDSDGFFVETEKGNYCLESPAGLPDPFC